MPLRPVAWHLAKVELVHHNCDSRPFPWLSSQNIRPAVHVHSQPLHHRVHWLFLTLLSPGPSPSLVEWYEGYTTPLPWPAFYGATRPVPFSPMPHAHGLHTWFAIPPSLLPDFALVWLFLRFSHDLTCQRLALLLLCLSSMLLMLSISFAALLTCQCQFPFLAHAVCVAGPHVHDSLPLSPLRFTS